MQNNSECCNNNCNQGRNCPARLHQIQEPEKAAVDAPVAVGEREALQAFVKFAEGRKEELGGLSLEMHEVLDLARAALAATPEAYVPALAAAKEQS